MTSSGTSSRSGSSSDSSNSTLPTNPSPSQLEYVQAALTPREHKIIAYSNELYHFHRQLWLDARRQADAETALRTKNDSKHLSSRQRHRSNSKVGARPSSLPPPTEKWKLPFVTPTPPYSPRYIYIFLAFLCASFSDFIPSYDSLTWCLVPLPPPVFGLVPIIITTTCICTDYIHRFLFSSLYSLFLSTLTGGLNYIFACPSTIFLPPSPGLIAVIQPP